MHLVGFIIRIFHDARSPERQINQYKSYGNTFRLIPAATIVRVSVKTSCKNFESLLICINYNNTSCEHHFRAGSAKSFYNSEFFKCRRTGNRRFIAENRRFIAENRRLIVENRRFIAENRRLIVENRRFIAENRRFIAENRRFIAEFTTDCHLSMS